MSDKRKRKEKRTYAISAEEMAKSNAREQERIEKWAVENGIPKQDARRKYFEHKRKEARKPVPENKELTLISKRSTRVNQRMLCDECSTIHNTLWRFSETSKGTVHLCTVCKNDAWARSSFDAPDALDLASTGGQFEGNRRKH